MVGEKKRKGDLRWYLYFGGLEVFVFELGGG